ncbi:MAG TPA: DUF6585 family protein [Ktedonobacteraceae bacterium]
MQSTVALFSPDVRQLGEEHELGKPVAVYRWGITWMSWWGIILGGSVFGLWLAVVIFSFSHVMDATPVLGPIILLWLALVVHSFYRRRYWRVCVYDQGLLIVKRTKVDVFRWEDVETFWQLVMDYRRIRLPLLVVLMLGPMRCKYKLMQRDGHTLVLTHTIRNADELGKVLNRFLIGVMFPRFLAWYEAGEEVAFGPLSVDREGIHKDRSLLVWDEIQSVQIGQNLMGVGNNIVRISRKGGGGWTLMLVTIPDVYVFEKLAQYILAQRTGDPS